MRQLKTYFSGGFQKIFLVLQDFLGLAELYLEIPGQMLQFAFDLKVTVADCFAEQPL